MVRRLAVNTTVQSAISKIIHARNKMELNKIGYKPQSVNDLLGFCRGFVDKDIILKEHLDSHKNHKIKSFVVKYDDRYEVVYLGDLNNCWKRFAICKELCHILLNDPSNYNPNIQEHVEDLFSLSMDHQSAKLSSTQDETVAEIAAMEYLFPYSNRIATTADKEIGFMEIAEKILVPRDYVEIYLSNHNLNSLRDFEYVRIDD